MLHYIGASFMRFYEHYMMGFYLFIYFHIYHLPLWSRGGGYLVQVEVIRALDGDFSAHLDLNNWTGLLILDLD